ncbi:MAG: RidA family protein, partial [Chloroflexi bacterium]|nr:RidA family protein [Chloroflexota bacterium]
GNRDPESGEVMRELCADKRGQARQALRCLAAALTRAGTDMDRMLSLEVYLRDIYFEDEFIEVAKDVFGSDCPAIGVAGAELEEGIEVQLVGVAGVS